MQDVTDMALQLRYRTTAARILDAHRKFLDASVRFYELSLAQVRWFCSPCVINFPLRLFLHSVPTLQHSCL